MRPLRKLILLGLLALVSPAIHAGQTALYMFSEPGDYIGGGLEYFYTDADLDFGVSRNYQNGVSVSATKFEWPNSIWWYLNFAAQGNQLLGPTLYTDATRYPFNAGYGTNGLSVYGNGRGCNTLTGSFEVLEIEYDANNQVTRFAVDFEQHCEGNPAALTGSLRINSDIPITYAFKPEIEILSSLNGEQCVEATGPDGALVELAGSIRGDDGTYVYEWSDDSGTTGTGATFATQVGLDETRAITLSVTNPATGETSTAVQPVCVSDTTAPGITILSPVSGEVFVGNDLMLNVEVTDAVDEDISQYEFFVGYAGSGSLDSSGQGTQKLSKPGTGSSYQSSITVTAEDASGNRATESVTFTVQHDFRPQ